VRDGPHDEVQTIPQLSPRPHRDHPLIDVMLFLRVTFIASLSMQASTRSASISRKARRPACNIRSQWNMTVTKDSHIFLDKTPVTLDDVAFKLKAILTTPNKGLVVNEDGNVGLVDCNSEFGIDRGYGECWLRSCI
jgi:hypothetical protein